MTVLRILAEWLTALLGVALLAWLVSEVSIKAMDAALKACRVHSLVCQFVFEREKARQAKLRSKAK